ncbi:hypothetical protein LCGC14_1766750 [marine sediment metagenome]|uniref:Uncharacterized protein n=1 Tax=marine sediment metagenome TaxID=412755 RepID=A0A0F9JZ55_9ZZZZ
MGATTFTQEDTRGRNDDGTIVTATYMGSGNNEDQSVNVDTPFRWRFVVQIGGMDAGDQNFQLWYSKNGGTYAQLTSTDGLSDGIRLINDANSIVDDSVTVQDIGDGTYTSGTCDGYCDGTTDDDTGTVNIAVGEEGEAEFCFEFVSADVVNGNTFDLRVRRGTTVLNTYTNTPKVTVIKAAAARRIFITHV